MKTLFTILSFLAIQFVVAQQIDGKIIDQITQIPIIDVTLVNTITQDTIPVSNGYFSINKIEVKTTFIASAKGYYPKSFVVTTSPYLIISLQPQYQQLEEVAIQQATIPKKVNQSAKAIHILSASDLQQNSGVDYATILNTVPGVFMQSGALNTNRISIRGIGARNLFGTANIRAYFGDIPLTDGNGASAIEDLELESISQIQIHKGPSSSSFGVGLGGTILLSPKKTSYQNTQLSSTYTIGSYGLQKTSLGFATHKNNADFNLLYSNTHQDGYRENNTYNRNTFTGSGTFSLSEKDELTFLASYIDLKAFIPSSLSQENFENDPRAAAFTWGRAKGFEDAQNFLLGTSWQHKFNDKLSVYTSVFGRYHKNDEPRPFNILAEEASSYGIRSRILGNHKLKQIKVKWTVGGEFFNEHYNGQTFENLYQEFPVGTGSVQGTILSDLDETRSYYNLFAEAQIQPHLQWYITIGTHLNQTQYAITNQLANTPKTTFDYDPIPSPKLGISYILNDQFNFYGTIAHGFSTPTASETLLPDGLFNPDLAPETGWNLEFGSRFNALNKQVQGSFAIYRMWVNDLLVTRRTPDDNFFAINAGKTIHDGIELDLNYLLIQTDDITLTANMNTAIYNYRFDEFIDDDEDFSGNDLTGVPDWVRNFGASLQYKNYYANANFRQVGQIPVNDQNSLYSDAYELLNAKIGYRHILFKHFNLNAFFGVNNILDKRYASQIQINARGFGGNAPRYFYPGLPIHVYGGININYNF